MDRLTELSNKMHNAELAYKEAERQWRAELIETSPIKVGDTVTANYPTTRFRVTRVYVGYGRLAYKGCKFKKDGTPGSREQELYSQVRLVTE